MSPHRVPSLLLLYLRGITPESAAAGGGIVVSVLAVLTPYVGDMAARLCVVAAVASLLDFLAGVLHAAANPSTKVTAAAAVAGGGRKLRRALIVPLGALVDWCTIILVPSAAPALKGLMPWTRLALVVYIGGEGLSIGRNIRDVIRIPRAMLNVLRAMAAGDVSEATTAGHTLDRALAPPGQAADRRRTDPPVE